MAPLPKLCQLLVLGSAMLAEATGVAALDTTVAMSTWSGAASSMTRGTRRSGSWSTVISRGGSNRVQMFPFSGGLPLLPDNLVHPPVDYLTLLPPPVGRSYPDPAFGTVVRRISDSQSTPDAASGSGALTFITNEYSTMSPFNQDGTRLILLHQSYFALYDGRGHYLHDLPFEINAASEPRWSRTRSRLLYYIHGNQLKSYDLSSSTSRVVHTFSEYGKISGRFESDISLDGDHFVLSGDGQDVFVYTISSDAKGPVLTAPVPGSFDNLQITPGNHVLVGWYQAGPGRFAGIEMYDRNMRFLRQLTGVLGHFDVGRDARGQEVMLWANAADPVPPPDCQNAIVKIRLADGARTCMVSFPWGMAEHVSVADQEPWFVVSTYAPSDPMPGDGWQEFTDEIVLVDMDSSQSIRLVQHRSRPFDFYYYEPRAALSRDGTRLVYTSNFGQQARLAGLPADYADVYLIDLSGCGRSPSAETIRVRCPGEANKSPRLRSNGWRTGSRQSFQGLRFSPLPGN